MGGSGSMIQAIKSLQANRAMLRHRNKFRSRKKELATKSKDTYGLKLTPSAKAAFDKRMDRAAYYGIIREIRLQVIIYLAAAAIFYWFWTLLS